MILKVRCFPLAHHGEHEVVRLGAVHPEHDAVRLARDEGEAQLVRLQENVDYIVKYFFYILNILLNFLFIYFKLILLRDPSAGNTEDTEKLFAKKFT